MKGDRRVDLSGVAVVDAHCHGFNAQGLAARNSEAWLDRITLMGMCLDSARQSLQAPDAGLRPTTEATLFACQAARELAAYLGCPPEAVRRVRSDRMAADLPGYVTDLLSSEHIVALFADDGYPLPPVSRAEFEQVTGARVYRVARIEPLIDQARAESESFEDLERVFEGLLHQAAGDPHCIAFKSIIAYRTGLDVGEPSRAAARNGYGRWRRAGWRDNRGVSKEIRDHLLNLAFGVARQKNFPVHIHTGGGDPDVLLEYARPAHLQALLKRHAGQPVVLVHGGYPWIEESAFLASVFPSVYLDLSLLVPWGTLYIERALELILGTVPADKIFHASDEASEPELLWLAARLARRSLERVLGDAVGRGILSAGEACSFGRAILGENALKVHGLAGADLPRGSLPEQPENQPTQTKGRLT